MVLFLGPAAGDTANWWPITTGDDYPIDELVAILPDIWAGTWFSGGTPATPAWVASDNPELAQAASEKFGGVPIYTVNPDGYSFTAPEA